MTVKDLSLDIKTGSKSLKLALHVICCVLSFHIMFIGCLEKTGRSTFVQEIARITNLAIEVPLLTPSIILSITPIYFTRYVSKDL